MKRPRIIIVGGGISALSLAWFLKQQETCLDICILEASGRAGGQIASTWHDGFLLEHGPHSFRSSSQSGALDRLLKGLSLQEDVIGAAPSANSRYLYFGNKLHRLPTKSLRWLCSRHAPLLIKALFRDITAPKGSGEDESLSDFVNRRLGKEVAERFFDPMVSGIYAGNLQTQSLAATFPRFLQWEQLHGSLLWGMLASTASPPRSTATGMPAICSFKMGMETLVDRLADALKAELRLNSRVESFDCSPVGVQVSLSSQQVIQGDHIFFAVPATVLKGLVEKHCEESARELQNIPAAPMAVVNLAYRKKLQHPHGFGYLIPSREKESILGVVFDSSTFPAQSTSAEETRLTVMLGGAKWEEFHNWSKDDFLLAALEGVKRHMGIDTLPDVCAVKVLPEALPQYHVGHKTRVQRIEKQLKQLSNRIHLLGNSFYGVSLPDCVQQAEALSHTKLHF